MLASLRQAVDRALARLPGWVILIGGLTLVGLGLLVPAWVESHALQWQLGLMREQARRLGEQEANYSQFDQALRDDDPVLLERLAYYHLRLKPAGTDALGAPAASAGDRLLVSGGRPGAAGGPGPGAPETPGGSRPVEYRPPSVEEMLHQPLPQSGIGPGVDYPAFQPERSRLVRVTQGFSQLVLIVAGMACIAAGLLATAAPPEVAAEGEGSALPPVAIKAPQGPAIVRPPAAEADTAAPPQLETPRPLALTAGGVRAPSAGEAPGIPLARAS